jgi:hypothetical protein
MVKGRRRGLPLSAAGLDEVLDGARRRAGLEGDVSSAAAGADPSSMVRTFARWNYGIRRRDAIDRIGRPVPPDNRWNTKHPPGYGYRYVPHPKEWQPAALIVAGQMAVGARRCVGILLVIGVVGVIKAPSEDDGEKALIQGGIFTPRALRLLDVSDIRRARFRRRIGASAPVAVPSA